LPIGEGQTISLPFMVGAMTDALELPDLSACWKLGQALVSGRGALGLARK